VDKRVKKLWLEALRSGQYKQTKERLTNGKGFCCLGVLCNIHALEKGRRWDRTQEDGIFYGRYECDGSPADEALPEDVMRWAGLKEHNPSIGAGMDTLADYNDSGKRFPAIANLIEKHL
jgi:hypothetical protein